MPDWRALLAGALGWWRAQGLVDQVLHLGSGACLLAILLLYATRVGNRRLMVKCLVLACGLHALSFGYAKLYLPYAARESTSLVRMSIRTHRDRPDPARQMTALSDPRTERPHIAESFDPERAAESDLRKRLREMAEEAEIPSPTPRSEPTALPEALALRTDASHPLLSPEQPRPQEPQARAQESNIPLPSEERERSEKSPAISRTLAESARLEASLPELAALDAPDMPRAMAERARSEIPQLRTDPATPRQLDSQAEQRVLPLPTEMANRPATVATPTARALEPAAVEAAVPMVASSQATTGPAASAIRTAASPAPLASAPLAAPQEPVASSVAQTLPVPAAEALARPARVASAQPRPVRPPTVEVGRPVPAAVPTRPESSVAPAAVPAAASATTPPSRSVVRLEAVKAPDPVGGEPDGNRPGDAGSMARTLTESAAAPGTSRSAIPQPRRGPVGASGPVAAPGANVAVAPPVASQSIDVAAVPRAGTPQGSPALVPRPNVPSPGASGGSPAGSQVAFVAPTESAGPPPAVGPGAPSSARRPGTVAGQSAREPAAGALIPQEATGARQAPSTAPPAPVRRLGGSPGAGGAEDISKILAHVPRIDVPLESERGGAPDEVPSLWGYRMAPNRLDIVFRHGGSPRTEKAVADALAWLAAHQHPDGFWDADGFHHQCPPGSVCSGPAVETGADNGVTGLALLAFLGDGHTHQRSRFDGKEDDLAQAYRGVVRRAIDWLVRTQRRDGDLRGQERIYSHCMATLALTEAYDMSKDPALAGPAQRAVDWLIAAQHRETGGWRYGPGQFGDTSVYGWAIMTLRSARNAGLRVPPEVWQRAQKWLSLVSSGPNGGWVAYQPGYEPSPAMTAEAMLCRQIFGVSPQDPVMPEAGAYVMANLPDPDPGRYHLYYWYYGTLSMFQLGGRYWQAWNEALLRTLLETQETSGHAQGSWTPQRPFGVDGGRVFTTATSALCLEVYYRYAPLYATSGKSGGP